MTHALRFAVAVGTSTDMHHHPAPDATCGHLHRSQETAERCLAHLLAYDPRTRTCSARWYNAYLVVADPSVPSHWRYIADAYTRIAADSERAEMTAAGASDDQITASLRRAEIYAIAGSSPLAHS